MLYAVISLAAMGLIFGVILGVASKKFAVEVDPRVESIQKFLPGANCGSCGFPGCAGYAEAVVCKGAPFNACSAGGPDIKNKIAEIMGTEAGADEERKVVQLICNGTHNNAKLIYRYEGIPDCNLAAAQFKGQKACNYGCLGLGSCEKACPFGAIKVGPEGLPVVDFSLCTGCGACVKICPQMTLKLVGVSRLVHVRCNNKDKGKDAKAACTVACIKCKICEKNCPADAIHVVAGAEGSVAVIDYDKCTNCGICVAKCPTKAIEIIPPIENKIIKTDIDKPVHTSCTHCGICQ